LTNTRANIRDAGALLPGQKEILKKKRKKKEKDRAIRDYVCTVTAKIPRWHSRYDTDFPRVFSLASKRNEERYYD